MVLFKLYASAIAVGMAATAFTTGHIVHAGYYDPFHKDYHPVPAELGFYQQWEIETHRDRMDLAKRNLADSRDYWNWRHRQQAQSDPALQAKLN